MYQGRFFRRLCAVAAVVAATVLSAGPAAADAIDPNELVFTIPDGGNNAGDMPLPASLSARTLTAQYPTITGAGQTVAIIDTGIDYNHPALAGRYVGGWDFVNNDADPLDDNGHGTHVAGIIASQNSTYPGLAPGANLVALKVLSWSGSGSYANVAAALSWVVSHREEYNITAVNLSLGAGNYTTVPTYSAINDPIATLYQAGVFVSVASGNSYYSYNSAPGLAYPAIVPGAVSVADTWDGNFGSVSWSGGSKDNSTGEDRLVSHAQRSSELDLVAPGALITSTYPNDRYATMGGTSMAAPYAAAAAVLARQAFEQAYGRSPTVDELMDIFLATGRPILDGDDEDDNVVNSGLSFVLLDPGAALASLTPAPEPTTLAFLGLGGLAIAAGAWRRRRAAA